MSEVRLHAECQQAKH